MTPSMNGLFVIHGFMLLIMVICGAYVLSLAIDAARKMFRRWGQ